MTGWVRFWDAAKCVFRLYRLPGGLVIGGLMLGTGVFTLLADLAVAVLVRNMNVITRCHFGIELVVDVDHNLTWSTPPPFEYLALIASNAQITSLQNRGMQYHNTIDIIVSIGLGWFHKTFRRQGGNCSLGLNRRQIRPEQDNGKPDYESMDEKVTTDGLFWHGSDASPRASFYIAQTLNTMAMVESGNDKAYQVPIRYSAKDLTQGCLINQTYVSSFIFFLVAIAALAVISISAYPILLAMRLGISLIPSFLGGRSADDDLLREPVPGGLLGWKLEVTRESALSESAASMALLPSEKSIVNDWDFGAVQDRRGTYLMVSRTGYKPLVNREAQIEMQAPVGLEDSQSYVPVPETYTTLGIQWERR
ncbi:hypothetical protein BDZ45DRAFT_738865 [Acephala macrosclerotiorum]|nr:hypothetical protein BDZ45DRAFT_738865 [Acephala macrosclerotiorum]